MSGADTLRVVTYNVRYASLDRGSRAWPNRRDAVAATIRLHDPDLLCLQEVWRAQLPDLRERLPGYEWVAERHRVGEHTPIGYRPERLDVVSASTFALAPDPDDVGATGWDAAVPRVATAATVRDRATDAEPDVTFNLVNVHFDHAGATARRESARLVRDRLGVGQGSSADRQSSAGQGSSADRVTDSDRALLVGDLNARPASGPYRSLVERPGPFVDARQVADARFGPGETYVGFDGEGAEAGADRDSTRGRRIDYVLVRGFDVTLYATSTAAERSWRRPSDHLPVVADLRAAAGP
ncbi:MAG: endonuclease/exonuclease/phosphatase family protein [Haloglomus sp.]